MGPGMGLEKENSPVSIKKREILLALAASSILASAAPAHATVTLLEKDDWKVGFYGFAEADAIVDSTRSFTEVVGNNPVARPGTFDGDNGRTQFSVRNSRLGFTIGAPKTGDWASKGVMEFDFLGPGNTASPEAAFFNNPTLRIRHFYLQAESSGWQLLAGQYWTLFGWQPNYFLATVSVAPVSGEVYERTTQFGVIKNFELAELSKLSAGLSIFRPAQRDSQIPGLDVGLRWAWHGRKAAFVGMTSGEIKAQPLSIGVSGRFNEFEYASDPADTTQMTHLFGSAIAVDGMLPIIGGSDDSVGNTLALSGEFTTGQGYGESFPAWTGNLRPIVDGGSGLNRGTNVDAGQMGVDPLNGVTLVHLQTYNLQLQYHLPAECMTFMTAGYGQLFSNNVSVLASGTYNRAETYFVNVGHHFTKQIRGAVEYDYFRTTYADSATAHDARVQASAFFYF
jgi:hypothetical protein